MAPLKYWLLLLLFYAFALAGNGQGCSDAGFCTIDSFKATATDSAGTAKANSLKLGVSAGKADHDITVFSSFLEYNRQLSEKISTDVKLVFISQNGNGIHASGLSDLYLNTNYTLTKTLRLTAGVKVPLHDGGRQLNGLALPMDYQPSLGTFDLIIGAGYEYRKLKLILALQQPLSQNNNRFLAQEYPPGSKLRQFQSTNNYQRSGDILFRVAYPFSLKKNLTLTPSLLPIYHLQNDRYTDPEGIERTINGSRGLTLNGNLYLDYVLNATSAFSLSLGAPFIIREVRPDGLTRSFVLAVDYKVKF